jgi:hypothetical protein
MVAPALLLGGSECRYLALMGATAHVGVQARTVRPIELWAQR